MAELNSVEESTTLIIHQAGGDFISTPGEENYIVIEDKDEVVISGDDGVILNVPSEETTLIIQQTDPLVVLTSAEVGPQGPQGEQGPVGPGGGDAATIEAGEDVGGQRIVAISDSGLGIYADYSDATAKAVYGWSVGAATTGNNITIQTSGQIPWPADDLTPDAPLFLGSNGLPTHTPPSSGWLMQVGTAVSSGLVRIYIGPAFFIG